MTVVTPFTSTLADRFPRKWVMVVVDLARAVLVAAAALVIAVDGPSLLVYALAIATSIAATPLPTRPGCDRSPRSRAIPAS